MTKFYALLLLAIVLIAGCKSASKAYDHGNYTEAIEIAVKKLQKHPHDGEMKAVLQNAYKFAVQQHEEQIRLLSNSTGFDRWEGIYQQYNALQRIYNNIQASPAAVKATKPVNYADYVRTYRDKTAEAYYSKGIDLMEKDAADRAVYRDAYYAFNTALKYKPNEAAIEEKRKEAKEMATVYVMIAPMDRFGGYMHSNAYVLKNFQTDLVRHIRYNINNEFVQFYTDWDNGYNRTRPDEILDMRLGTFNIGRPYDENKVREVTKEVVVKETVYKKDSVVKEYAKVKARITTTKRTLVSTADMLVNILDARNRTLWNDNIRGEHRWTVEFSTYTGDERALNDNDKTLLNKQNRNAPAEEEIVENLLRQLQNDVTYRLRDYYRRHY